MAGYLGTLFMANVGMRLLLPPKSEYNQAATSFGRMVGNIQSKQSSYFSRASKNQVSALRQTLQQSSSLASTFGKKGGQETLRQLRTNLNQIKNITNSSMSSVNSKMSATSANTQRIGSIIKRMPQSVSMSSGGNATFAAKYAHGLKAIQVELNKISIAQAAATKSIIGTADAMAKSGAYMLSTYSSALRTTITLLTTVGYTISGLSSDFSTFENELINANSIWQETNETLFEISDRVIKFGEDYGVAYDNASRVLYQFASAGLEAAEAQAVLNDVLLLSMAVQGDANTIGKLTVQTIKGFGLEMSQAGEVTDKFAHSINASLIEYQDLASAIKFALPFYAATNQDLNQLLGSIQILTDRALEAGIAGRGLRQALAEFAEGAEDATRKFAQMGVEVVNQEGEFLQMTEIARNFANVIGEGVANDTELLTSLIEDLNIRGATAFIHLVQNVDEFEEAVSELAHSQGASKKMADMQQTSLANMTQKMRNAMKEVFFLSEAQFVANGHLNEFDMRLKSIVTSFTELFLTQLPDGTKKLTQFSYDLREAVITTLEGFSELLETIVPLIIEFTQGSFNLSKAIEAMFVPLRILNHTLMLSDKLLGVVGQEGLLFKFGALSMMFGATAAGALMVADAIGAMMEKMGEINKVVGPILTIASLAYGGGGLRMAYKGASSAAGKTALSSGRYKSALSSHKSLKFPGGKPPSKMVKPDNYKSLNQMRMEGNFMADGQTNLDMYGLSIGRTLGQQRFKTPALGTGKYRRMYANQQQPYDASLLGGQGLKYLEDTKLFQSQYLTELGMSRAKYGAFGAYAFGRSSLGFGQNRASDPMMAQMDSSSNYGDSQDLYIANANIGSSNFQDLFYNTDQLGN